MVFYRINAEAVNFKMDIDHLDEYKSAIQTNCEMFYQKCRHSAYFYISALIDNKIIAGCIAKTTKDFVDNIDQFWNSVDINASDANCEEISLHATRTLLRRSYRQDYISNDDEILDLFELSDLFQSYKFEFGEYLTEQDISQNELKKKASELLCEDTLIPELDRIYAGAKCKFKSGNPVHYLIQTDSRTTRSKMIDILMSALYANNRIQSRRYCTVTYSENDHAPDDTLDKLYECCAGNAIVTSYTVKDQIDSEFANASTEVVSKLCNIICKHKNEVLSVICLPRSCEKIKDAFYSHLSNITLVELTEEIVFGEKARNYLCRMANNNNTKADEKLLSFVKGDRKGYTPSELSEHFDRWFNNYMKTDVFPQYSDFAIAQSMIQNEHTKGDAYSQLQQMIGLNEAKKVIAQALDYHKAQLMFKQHGMKADRNAMHMVFTGNPGTAKTTVARLFAQIMKDNGLLSKGDLYEVGRADLVGKYIGWTAKIVKEKFNLAKGSVLFIDEAYSLLDDRSGMYGDEAINTIVQEMENNREDIVVIFAGYPHEMEQFLDRNPGLRSRIAFHIPFEDYTPEELYEIAKLTAEQKGVTLSDDTKEFLISEFEKVTNSADFGNGRYVRNIIEQAKMRQATRLVQMAPESVTKDMIRQLECQDFEFATLKPQVQKISFGFAG